jgi:NAD(P)-dependent dehydrogenase (short-subunit alcohol dehydrogenase family)
MRLAGKVVVITGGGSGIGRALALQAAGEGAQGVVVADLDGDAAIAVAGEIGDRALAAACDVTAERELRALLDRTEGRFGEVDAYFSNAGVAIGESEQTDDATWDLAFAVNVRASVLAARLLVPRWLDRGAGCFVQTASAAGLLTQIGSAPYAVTKHAAVAFAEWLAVTYGDRGIHVSCLCPMGVATPMLDPERPPEDAMQRSALAAVRAAGPVLDPADVAGAVIDGLDREDFLILPHPEVLEYFRRKASDYDRWLTGMQRLRRNVSGESPADVESAPERKER